MPVYNRYIPQPDGSYRRQPGKEPKPSRPAPRPNPPTSRQPEPHREPPEHNQSEQPHRQPPARNQSQQPHRQPPVCNQPEPHRESKKCDPPEKHSAQKDAAGNFLSRLLPGSFDAGDLLVIALLLLMAGDCPESKNTALLTLAMYFIL